MESKRVVFVAHMKVQLMVQESQSRGDIFNTKKLLLFESLRSGTFQQNVTPLLPIATGTWHILG